MEILLLIEQEICKSITLYTVERMYFHNYCHDVDWPLNVTCWLYALILLCSVNCTLCISVIMNGLSLRFFLAHFLWLKPISACYHFICVSIPHARCTYSLSHFFAFSVFLHTIYLFCMILIIDGFYSSSFLYYFAENTILWL